MNAKNLIAAIAILAGTSSAFAAEWVDFIDFQSTKTRAEVIAELKDAQAQGTYVAGGNEFTAPDARFASTKTRAQVMAELKQAQEDGSYALAHQEFDGQYPGLTNGSNAGSRLARGGKAANVN
ncbi:DUF4148 domain-containing protein [Noviherbaspirillum saxi]|uniref:DUF4148 domain-containing protein n=1 Tax=Noviherbaspirillum saxi TaxID=2320863 RepID=A0A3A3FUU2_9BURK|nr:DUF4148 domain-containing protein [Noviherbaspirillum saxi]RJF97961.1 DUF4148 domain-containing protein [Noviherbaspirillum saxi]